MRTTPSFHAERAFNNRHLEGNWGPEHIARIKTLAGLLWDEINDIPVKPAVVGDDPGEEPRRLKQLAKDDLERAVMFAVKAVSRHNGVPNERGNLQA